MNESTRCSPSWFLSALLSQHLFSPFHFPPRRCLLSSPSSSSSSSHPFPRQRLFSSPLFFSSSSPKVAWRVLRGGHRHCRNPRNGGRKETEGRKADSVGRTTTFCSLQHSSLPPCYRPSLSGSPADPRLEVAWKVGQTKMSWSCPVVRETQPSALWRCAVISSCSSAPSFLLSTDRQAQSAAFNSILS